MEQQGLRTGHLIALAGALVTLSSLWRPWYAIELPAGFRDALAGQMGQDPGVLGQVAKGVLAALPSRIEASGWRELAGADVALCVAALAVIALVLGAAGALGRTVHVDRLAAGRAIGALGLLGAILVAWHVLDKPGSGALGGDLVKLASGIWLALGGCVLMAVGGLLAGTAEPALPYSPEPPASFDGLAFEREPQPEVS